MAGAKKKTTTSSKSASGSKLESNSKPLINKVVNTVDITELIKRRNSELVCSSCGKTLKSENFYHSASKGSIMRADEDGKIKMHICHSCCEALFMYLYKIDNNDANQAFYDFCSVTGTYYNTEVITDILKKVEQKDIIPLYMRIMENNLFYSTKSFTDSEKFIYISDDTELSEKDLENKKEVINLYGMDPFEKNTTSEKKRYYRELSTMIDSTMADDLVKQKAALNIIRSFAQNEKLTETLEAMQRDPELMAKHSKEVKELVATQKSQIDTITKLTKDHGFAERYQNSRNKGAGTLSAIMRDAADGKYDRSRVNLYDIKTSDSMRQVADISTASIFAQLSLSEAEQADMIKTQGEFIRELTATLERRDEEIRLIRTQITKQELLKELYTSLVKKGMKEDEISKLILEEIYFEEELFERKNKKK